MAWHMHHRGDSVSEGGSQAGGRNRREIAIARQREDKRKEKEKERGGATSLKLGQLHLQSP